MSTTRRLSEELQGGERRWLRHEAPGNLRRVRFFRLDYIFH